MSDEIAASRMTTVYFQSFLYLMDCVTALESKESVLQLSARWPGLWMAARLEVTLLWYRPLCTQVSVLSFDVKSQFTNIPLQLALQCTESALQQSTVKLPLPTEDIMDLLNLCLTSTYFQYIGKHYKQNAWNSHGVACFWCCRRIVMQHVENASLPYRQLYCFTLLWRHLYRLSQRRNCDFHDHLNEQKADTQSTKKIEKKGNFFL